jgi:hypothetical protein
MMIRSYGATKLITASVPEHALRLCY